MASLDHIDLLLGETIERILEAADGIKEKKELDRREHLKRIGRVVAEIWGIREEVHKIRPDLKRDFHVEYDKDRKKFETLNTLFKKAQQFEKDGNIVNSKKLYDDLYRESPFGYFRLLAEAGLYRTGVPSA